MLWLFNALQAELETMMYLLSVPETQKANTETFEFQQDVVNSRMRVAG